MTGQPIPAARVSIAVTACLALLAGTIADVRAQRGALVTQTTQPIPFDVTALRDRIAGLDGRVAELERKVEELERKGIDALKAASDKSAAEARLKTLEQRLASVEKAAAAENTRNGRGGKPAPADADEPATVQAPFVVRVGNRVIFRVDVPDDTQQPRLLIGNPVGARVVLGMTKDETPNVVLYTRDNRYRAAMMGDVASPQVMLSSSAKSVVLTGGALQFNNTDNTPIVTLGLSENGNGRLQLADAAGTTMVEAGTNASGFGIVRAGPQFGGPVGSLTIPWHIQGRKAQR